MIAWRVRVSRLGPLDCDSPSKNGLGMQDRGFASRDGANSIQEARSQMVTNPH